MTFDEFKILVKGMKAVYTSPNFLPDADSIKIWYQMLRDLEYRTANVAIQKYMMTNKFPPTIADIRELSTTVQHGELPDWGEGWEQVLQAIRKYGSYRPQEAMDSMDELTRQCVERLGFKNICMSENINTDRANFRMIYEQLASRKQKEAVMPVGLLQEVERIRLAQQKPLGLEDMCGKSEV